MEERCGIFFNGSPASIYESGEIKQIMARKLRATLIRHGRLGLELSEAVASEVYWLTHPSVIPEFVLLSIKHAYDPGASGADNRISHSALRAGLLRCTHNLLRLSLEQGGTVSARVRGTANGSSTPSQYCWFNRSVRWKM